MLAELTIANYAVIDHLRLRLGRGFNVLTGETGAGKSIIIGALSFVLGERAHSSVVRAGEPEAVVEAIFDLDVPVPGEVSRTIPPGDGQTLIMAREMTAAGRSTCRINGRAVPLRMLQEVGLHLVDVHGQGGHLSLLRVAEHVELLDRFGGFSEERRQLADQVRTIVALRTEIQRISDLQTRASERAELLQFQTNEINAARLREGEEEELLAERNFQLNAEKIGQLLTAAVEALQPHESSDPRGSLELLSEAESALAMLETLDPRFEEHRKNAEALRFQLEDLRRELAGILSGHEFDQQRLDDVQERIGAISHLKRKYGGSIAEINAFAERARVELESLAQAESSISRLTSDLQDATRRAAKLAAALSTARRESASRLAQAVEAQLQGLGMAEARLAVQFTHQPAPEGLPVGELGFHLSHSVVSSGSRWDADDAIKEPLRFDATGVDRVEFLISANPGEPLRPLAKVASGGETARLMLAIKNVLSQADTIPTLVFDEVDSGIGGRVAEAVGRRLWSLGRRHQVMAVTHLPQIACYGDVHLTVSKGQVEGRTVTRVVPVEGEDRLRELSQMLGSDTPATRRKAEELLADAKSSPSEHAEG